MSIDARLPQLTSVTKPESETVKKFRSNFKEITFATLKQRHDNFSFEKTIESRPLIYTTVHFEKINEANPNQYDKVLFPRKLQPINKFIDESLQSPVSPSMLSRMVSDDSFIAEKDQGPTSAPHTETQDEQELWKEFKNHFRNTRRKRVAANHHDILLNSAESEIIMSSPPRFTQQETGVGDKFLSHDHRQRTVENYQRLQETAMPLNKIKSKDMNKLVKRARYRFETQREEQTRSIIQEVMESHLNKKQNESLHNQGSNQIQGRKFPLRHIYFILDGQNIDKIDSLTFMLLEVNQRLNNFISQKIWDSKEAKKMDFYQKVDFANPTQLMLEQNLLDILFQLQTSLIQQKDDTPKPDIKYAWTIDGKQIKSIMDLHQQCRIVLVSALNKFQGIQIEADSQQHFDEVKPKPSSWVNQATTKWTSNHQTSEFLNYAGDSTSIQSSLSLKDSSILQSVIGEHIRIHYQDQSLLKTIENDQMLIQNNSFSNYSHSLDLTSQNTNTKQQEDMQAFILKHSFAVAYANISYDFVNDEQQIIDHLLKKVVLMRELPLVKATHNLQWNQDLSTIEKRTKRLGMLTNKKSRQSQSISTMPSLDINKVTQVYDGGDSQSSIRQGMATFRAVTMKKESQLQISSQKQLQQPRTMLPSEEIIRISEKNKLSRADVFQVRSLFGSMCKLSSLESGSLSERNKIMTPEGISIDFFTQNCSFLLTAMPEISLRILIAAGLDINSVRAQVDWDTFLKLYCIFEVGNIEKQKQIVFWSKFFDQELKGFCKEEEYMDVLEKLVRGKCFDEPNQFSMLFAQTYQASMKEAGCLGPIKEIIIEKLEAAYYKGTLDINTLSESLGREKV